MKKLLNYLKKLQKMIIQDSLKLIPYSEKTICQAFKLDTQKGEIDYKKQRDETYIPTKEEIEYIKNDIKIINKGYEFVYIHQSDRSNCKVLQHQLFCHTCEPVFIVNYFRNNIHALVCNACRTYLRHGDQCAGRYL